MQWVNEERLTEVLSHVDNNPHSSFYAKKYGNVPLTVDVFSTLPLLSRRELTDAPVVERTYVAPQDVRFVAFTSGTSARAPLITPFSDIENYFVEPSLGLRVRRPLIIYPPLNKNFGASFMQQCRQAVAPVSPMFADFQNLSNSAVVAEEMGCDSLYATPTIALLFASEAHRRGIERNFKLLALSSETLTRSRREELLRLFPEAKIANLYASSEIGQFAMFPCIDMIGRGVDAFHLNTSALAAVELIEGELVVSYGLNKALPLIRYRTNDFFEEASPCACGLAGPVLKWSHRDTDRVRINGLEFTVEEADRVMGNLPHLPTPLYQVHFEDAASGGVRMRVEIVNQALAARPEEAAVLARTISEELPRLWKVSSTASLETALERGLLSEVRVDIVPALSEEAQKAKRFVSHVR
jgi:phenylacetate-coenzyme A ligase PaaK-like adenylate-forming protein